MKLSKIAKGELDDRVFMSEIRGYTKELLQEIRREEGTFRHENMTIKNVRIAGNDYLPSMERMRNFWCARIVPADTGKLYPGQRTPDARSATNGWK